MTDRNRPSVLVSEGHLDELYKIDHRLVCLHSLIEKPEEFIPIADTLQPIIDDLQLAVGRMWGCERLPKKRGKGKKRRTKKSKNSK